MFISKMLKVSENMMYIPKKSFSPPLKQRSEYISHSVTTLDSVYQGVGSVHGGLGPFVYVSVVITADTGPAPSISSAYFLANGGGVVVKFSRYTNKPVFLFSPPSQTSYYFEKKSVFFEKNVCWLLLSV